MIKKDVFLEELIYFKIDKMIAKNFIFLKYNIKMLNTIFIRGIF